MGIYNPENKMLESLCRFLVELLVSSRGIMVLRGYMGNLTLEILLYFLKEIYYEE